jgi:asparagine synthase (glutamine-hydrolysing)
MCGILAFFDFEGKYNGTPEELKAHLMELSKRQTSRGPDESGYHGGANWGLAHERLSIMDPEHGKQPITHEADGISVVANGEIYNFRELLEKHGCS